MTGDSDRYRKAIEAFDDYHRKDPRAESVDGKEQPAELLYARRMTERLQRFAPDAGEALRLAARCQHIGRWEIARDSYPRDRRGYLLWRNEEKAHHARIAERILGACGYDEPVIRKVKSLLLKKELHADAESQLLEDVVCLVFIEHYLAGFAAQHEEEKVVDILRKTLRKMSDKAKNTAADLPIPDHVRSWIHRAQSAA